MLRIWAMRPKHVSPCSLCTFSKRLILMYLTCCLRELLQCKETNGAISLMAIAFHLELLCSGRSNNAETQCPAFLASACKGNINITSLCTEPTLSLRSHFTCCKYLYRLMCASRRSNYFLSSMHCFFVLVCFLYWLSGSDDYVRLHCHEQTDYCYS